MADFNAGCETGARRWAATLLATSHLTACPAHADSWLSFWIWVWEEKSGICVRASNRAEPETIPHCSDGKSGKADEKWHTENKRKNINKESIPGESEMSGAEDAALPGG